VSFLGINIASRSLQATQKELEVTGQNISNANTPGYSRQIAVITSVSGAGAVLRDRSGTPLAPGGGVDVAQVLRSHAAWLDRATEGLGAQVGQSKANEQNASAVESLLSEPGDAGLQSTLGRMFAAFNNLASHPDDMALRDQAVRASQEVGQRFLQLTNGLGDLKDNVVTQAAQNVDTVNQLIEQVANLDKVIGQAQAAGGAPNEILDQRDQLLADLSRIAGATVSGRDGSKLVVSIGGITIVQGEEFDKLAMAPGNGFDVVVASTGTTVQVAGGEMRAQQEWAATTIPNYLQQVQALRDQFAASVNALHTSGNDLTGTPGQPFFTTDSGGNITVNPLIAADSRRVVAGDGTAGDGQVAQAIANLRTTAGSILPTYQTLVANIGASAADASRFTQQTTASLQQIQGMQASESGVNLDEELAKMVSLQHAYAASAKLLTAYDSMLGTLISTASATGA
jgi:flagellar hook-associated protein 1 FlgK